jgi:hypothetical protein
MNSLVAAKYLMRKIMALGCALGCLAGIYFLVLSFFGLTMNRLGERALLLHAGIFAFALPLIFLDKSRGEPHRFSRSELAATPKPRWVRNTQTALFVFFLICFAAFLLMSHGAAPDIKDGEYVLNSHGTIVGYISEKEYHFLKASELRLFASGWLLVYFILMVNWWFPKREDTPWAVDV